MCVPTLRCLFSQALKLKGRSSAALAAAEAAAADIRPYQSNESCPPEAAITDASQEGKSGNSTCVHSSARRTPAAYQASGASSACSSADDFKHDAASSEGASSTGAAPPLRPSNDAKQPALHSANVPSRRELSTDVDESNDDVVPLPDQTDDLIHTAGWVEGLPTRRRWHTRMGWRRGAGGDGRSKRTVGLRTRRSGLGRQHLRTRVVRRLAAGWRAG